MLHHLAFLGVVFTELRGVKNSSRFLVNEEMPQNPVQRCVHTNRLKVFQETLKNRSSVE
jgi:hypothetical protein